MTQENRNFVTEKIKAALAAPSCCAELKEIGMEWLEAAGSDHEAAATKSLIHELEEDVCTIDDVLAFFESPAAEKIFGADKAKAMAAHAREIQSKGAKWCDCPACAACAKLLGL